MDLLRASQMQRYFTTAAVMLAIVSCAPAAQRAYVAPSPETVFSQTDERQSDPPVHTISIVNHSTVPITVWSISLNGCENIKQTCGPKPVNMRVPPSGRVVANRVEPEAKDRGFRYSFGFSWRVDSGSAALSALASAGDPAAQQRLDARRRADSISRSETGRRYSELSRDAFASLSGRPVVLRADPDTVFITPGERVSVEGVRVLVVDSAGQVMGRTKWVRWQAPASGPVSYSPAESQLRGLRPGRAMLRFELADEAQQLIGREVPPLEVPVVVRYAPVANAPVFLGRALDADLKKPLACARVALEDSAQNVVANSRTNRQGEFILSAPIPGTYRVRVDAHGWAPVHGPATLANVGDEKQNEYLIRFTDQVLVARFRMDAVQFEPPRPISVRVDPVGSRAGGTTSVVQAVTLGGSESMPILGIVTSRVPPLTAWMQIAIDSTGQVDAASLQLPAATPASAKPAVASALTRMRFAPAKEDSRPVCELMRMQVSFTPR